MTHDNRTYSLLDAGNGAKLEQVGPFLLRRPAPQATWRTHLDESAWDEADAVYTRDSSGSGKWAWKKKLPEQWDIEFEGLTFQVKPTGFGHLGLFPEHAACWRWMEKRIRQAGRTLNVLNLFAYTGGATLAAARAGAHVCHLDASKGAVAWARTNACKSGLEESPIRWIVDDIFKFLRRELRRKVRYEALVLDPPSFGRGAKGEVFKIERDLQELLDLARRTLVEKPEFVILSCHSPGFTPLVLHNLLEQTLQGHRGKMSEHEMVIQDASARPLPSGALATWEKSH